ncbi:tail fiber chaperone [Klebsiella phage Marfa]|uniref:Chaperone for tail fiber formation n=1 Tax=Klebsiella phage Marfa TaxID=2587809 RepID=A0A4Y5TQY3_9CAUD|nr:tail fiber chaperone [Klebsiella phage Marfa]QDB71805.1 hypothetical protein CPT_Marfa_157 [Klebsiella phage Marfa]
MSQDIINALKVRVFDLSEVVQASQDRIKELEAVLGELVQILPVKAKEDGSYELAAIVEAAKSVVLAGDAEDEAEAEAEVEG